MKSLFHTGLLTLLLLISPTLSRSQTTVEQTSSPPGKWRVERDVSALTDANNVYWILQSENMVRNAIRQEERALLMVMCHQNETRFIFDLQNYMGSSGIKMAYRIDKGQVRRETVNVSEGGRTFGYWNGTGIPFLKQLASSSNLVIAAKPYSEGDVEAIFALDGIDQVISDVRKTCKW
ncbi:type VI secretion system-associated protein TagO [Aestuariivirga sp.]|uniref:type VI secretion system-associated protein TagO n=1 Tax=Aestuariivirga sp. TaxID=2650926 RepID=UPI003594683E